MKKAEKLREMLEESGDLSELHCALPLDPSVHLAGIISQECSVFKSALSPLRLTFRTVGRPPCLSVAAYAGNTPVNCCRLGTAPQHLIDRFGDSSSTATKQDLNATGNMQACSLAT